MEDLLLRQLEARKQRRPYAVATIVEATGSTPRTEGKMLVYADGSSIGTIGGGIAELQAKKDAVEAIRSGKNALVRYEVVPQGAQAGMVCGGALQVFLEVWHVKPLLVVCGGGHCHQRHGRQHQCRTPAQPSFHHVHHLGQVYAFCWGIYDKESFTLRKERRICA